MRWLWAGLGGVAVLATSTWAFAEDSASGSQWSPANHEALPEHHVRSLVEMTAGLALGSVAYWLMQDRNVADWDNPRPEERFTGRAWRLDNNSLAVNFIAHPFFGGLAQSMARANHHDVLTSFAYSSLTSFLWEFVLEFKEKVSVNDMIVTSPTGVPIGEFFYKLGLYLDTAQKPGLGTNLARWALGTGVALDTALDGRERPRVKQRDRLGFTRRIWHRFEAGYGIDLVESPGVESVARHHLDFAARLVTLPGYLGPTEFERSFYQAEVSDFWLSTELSSYGAGISMNADSLLVGYHVQRMRGTALAFEGFAATFGVGMAYSYVRSTANRHVEFEAAEAAADPDVSYHVASSAEQYAALQLPGPALDWHVRSPLVSLFMSARANPSFAGLGAPAFYDFAAANLDETSKHILHRQGYFYGWGGAGSLRGQLSVGPLVLSGHVFYGAYRSQDGLDRHIERVTADVPVQGDILMYGSSLGIRPPGLPVVIGADFGVRRWSSRVTEYETRGRSLSRGFSGRFEF